VGLGVPGVGHSVLSEFRDRLNAGDAGLELLDRVLETAAEHAILKAGGQGALTDSTIVLSAARQIIGLARLSVTCGPR
jgi:transposase